MHISLAPRHSLRQVVAHGLIGASIAFAAAFAIDTTHLVCSNARSTTRSVLAPPSCSRSRSDAHVDGPSTSATGIVLGRVEPGSMFARVGLRSGDVITHIEGLPVLGNERGFEAWVEAHRLVVVEIERGGRRALVSFSRAAFDDVSTKSSGSVSAFDSALTEK